MNIKLLMMIAGAMVLSDVGFASTVGSLGAASQNVDVNTLPGAEIQIVIDRPSESADGVDLVETSTTRKLNPKKYGSVRDVANYVYKARNDVVQILQADIAALEQQAAKMEAALLKLESEDAAYFRAQDIEKERLKTALSN